MRKIFIDEITPGMVLEADVYKESRTDGLPLLCKGSEITAKFIYALKQHGIYHLHAKDIAIPGESSGNSSQGYDKNLLSIISIPAEKSKSIVKPKTKEEVIKTMKNFHISLSGMDAEEVGKVIDELDNVLARVLGDFPENPVDSINVHQLRNDEDSLYVRIYKHSLSVSVISMALGQFLSLPKEDILSLGKCAVLHDIGMFFAPVDLLKKTDTLDQYEFEMVKKHTNLGYNALKKLGITDKVLCEGVACHHERLNGLGYPLGLQGDKIPLWSRIIAVADVYDAMTNPRPHRLPLSPSEAYEYMMANAHTSFEYDIVMALLRRIEFYPVGVCVELSNKNIAVVLDNSQSKLRPIVRIVNSNAYIDLNKDQNFLDVTIIRTVKLREILDYEERKTSKFRNS